MIAAPTETSMPPVMMMIVMPTPISAIGAVATSSGWIEPGGEERRGGEARGSTQSTAMTPISTSSWPVTGDGRIRLRGLAAARRRLAGRQAGIGPVIDGGAHAACPFVVDGAGGGGEHVDLGGVGSELDGGGAAADDLQPVGDAQRLGQVGGHHQHGGAALGQLGDDPVDLLLGADVDALGRLGQHQHLRPLDELAGQHDLLRVAAGHRADRLPLVRRLAPRAA